MLSLIPLAILALIAGWAMVSLINEARLAGRLREPSVCMRCRHGLTDAMLAMGRCPECGTPYILGGIDTPRVRLDRHRRVNGSPGAVVLIAIGPGVLVGWLSSLAVPRTEEWVHIVAGIAGWAVFSALFIGAIVYRRRLLRIGLDRKEAEWNTLHDAKGAPIAAPRANDPAA